MTMDTTMRDLLYRSLDAELSAADRARLDAALKESAELRNERDQLVAIRTGAAAAREGGFGPYFAERVMTHVTSVPQPGMLPELLAVFRPVALASVVLLAALVPVAGRTLMESLSTPARTLTSIAQEAYALDLEDIVCQADSNPD
jgi:hypothetical protein